MNKRILKYPLNNWEFAGTMEVPMCAGAVLLSVQVQGDTPYVWALVDISQPVEVRRFSAYYTGTLIKDDPGTFLGTVQLPQMGLVLHVFEVTQRGPL